MVLVISDPNVRETLLSATGTEIEQRHGFEPICAHSLAEAAVLAEKTAAAIIVFDFQQVDDALVAQVAQLRRTAPAALLCAVSPIRDFFLEESNLLKGAGVHAFLGAPVLNDRKRLFAFLQRLAANSSGSRVLAYLTGKLSPASLRIAHLILLAVCSAGPSGIGLVAAARLRNVRRELGTHPTVPAEREDIAVRLLLLIDLAERSKLTVSDMFNHACFPTANNARELLHSYAMVNARELNDAQLREKARLNLVRILRGEHLPERRRTPRIRETERPRDRETKRPRDQETKRPRDQETKRPRDQETTDDPPDSLQGTT